jgi:hypothetical protein
MIVRNQDAIWYRGNDDRVIRRGAHGSTWLTIDAATTSDPERFQASSAMTVVTALLAIIAVIAGFGLGCLLSRLAVAVS